jgi:hypothetical protein
MSRKIIFALIYHRHKLLDLIYITSKDLVYVYPKCRKFERLKIQRVRFPVISLISWN